MPNWNLSVALRATGDLPKTLKATAKDARSLDTALKSTVKEVGKLGTESRTATKEVKKLGSTSRSTARDIDTLAASARAAQRQLVLIAGSSGESRRNIALLRTESRNAANDLRRMSSRVSVTIRDLDRLAAASRTARTAAARIGDDGTRSMGRMDGAIGRVRDRAAGLLTLLAGGALIAGAGKLVENGNELNQTLNQFGATSNATRMQMARAGAVANQLGSDLKLPKVSAVEAADAMVELSKAGFRTDQAIDSTRAALLLSAAAQTDAADSAKYLGDIMDQFGLSADQASKTADTLAATANNASGGVKDIYYAMSYAGPVAHGLGIDMQDAATGVGMLAKSGILGSKAGTALRGILTNLAKPTNQMSDGLKTLGINAWDAQGNFKGLRYVIDQLHTAQQKLSPKAFTAAAGKAFGKPALASAVALAHQGTESFDALNIAVRQQGAAAAIAAAQGKGLAGAMVQLKTQSKQTGLAIYDGMAPALEYITRGLTKGLAESTPYLTAWFKHLNSAAYLYGPDLKKEFSGIFSGIGHEARGLGASFKGFGTEVAADALNVLLNAGEALVTVLKNVVHGAEPVVHALGDIGKGGDGVSTALDTAVFAFDATAKVVGQVSGVLGPLGRLVGALVQDFSSLPGPVQSAILAMLLARRVAPVMTGLAGTVGGRLTGSFRSFGAQMAVQRTLAASAGVSLSRYGAAFAVLQTRIPVIGRITDSFRTASTTGGRFTGTLRGIGAAATTSLRSGMSGLVGFLGGPWGVAIAAGTVALGFWAAAQQKAAQATAEHKASVSSLTQAFRDSNGAINDAVREQAANVLQTTKVKGGYGDLVTILGKAGYSLKDTTDAYLGQGTSLKTVATRLDAMSKASDKAAMSQKRRSRGQDADIKAGLQYSAAADAVRDLIGESDEAAKKARDLNSAIKGTSGGTSAYDRLKSAVSDLSDSTSDADSRTRALKQALDLLSGGTLDYQAAEAQMNQAISNANDQLADGVNKAEGYKKALLNTNGSISTVTKNGQQLYSSLTDIADGATNAATAAFSLAQSQGKDLPTSIAAASKEMQRGRDAAIKLSGQYGITGDDAKKVADSMGLIPGQVAILLETQGVDGVMAELLAVQAQIKQTPGKKTITVDALSADAQTALKNLGYKIRMIPGTRQFQLTVPTGTAKSAIDSLQRYINSIPSHKTVTVTINGVKTGVDPKAYYSQGPHKTNANGSVTDYYASGGMRERHVAQLAPAGAMRVWAEPETDGEGYVPFARSKRPRSRAITEEIVRRLGGDPSAIQWNANGSVTAFDSGGFSYSPSDPARSLSDVQSGYDSWHQPISRDDYLKAIRAEQNAVGSLRTAEARLQQVRSHKHTHAALVSAENSVAKARRTVATATNAANTAEKRYKQTFSLTEWSGTLGAAVRESKSYEASLSRIASRGGSDIIDQLRSMGTEGADMVAALAKASTKQFNSIVANLRRLGPLAKATLADYTSQINASNKVSTTFEANLSKLAGQGYGALAAQLAGQGDDAAQAIAAQAVKNKTAAAKANASAKAAGNALSSDQLAELVQIIGSVSSNKVGIHTVADATGIEEDEIVTVAGKAASQIKTALGSRSSKFLADLARAQKGLSYDNGGIRPGIYSTTAGALTFAEPSTGGEGFVPLGQNKRPQAMRVMYDIAHRFGLGLTAAGSAGGVTVIRQEGDTHISVSTVRTGATGSDIGAQVARSYRRAKRGGVNARG
ncbi:phage tail tape measure protein [Streptomyces sp. NBC_01476]|uniref:phage tail tape measure protein n=1 Tax=Streptomyces sp. NBC_01476 TaxID=2903881 RepID=UPI002E2F7436|nr:phage tail tape measure protein [Streptomyces sp. NBC_01476]